MQGNRERVKRFYDSQVAACPDWPAVLGVGSALAADLRIDEEWRRFLAAVPLTDAMTVVELGCGAGRWCERIAPRVRHVVGVDLSGVAIEAARRSADARGLRNVAYVQAPLEDFEPDSQCDLIYFSGVLLYLTDAEMRASLDRLATYVTDAGTIVVRDSITDATHWYEHPEGYRTRYRTEEELTEAFASVGFQRTTSRKAFPNLCLRKVLRTPLFARSYLAVQSGPAGRVLLRWLAAMALDRDQEPQWSGGEHWYSHRFLVFSRCAQ